MRSEKTFLLLILFIALIAAGALIFLKRGQTTSWFSSPTTLRKSDNYDELLYGKNSGPSLIPIKIQNLTVTNKGSQLEVFFNEPANQRSLPDYSVTRVALKPPNPARIGEGSIELECIGIGSGAPSSNTIATQWSYEVPATFYGSDLKPLSSNAVEKVIPEKWERRIQTRGQFPTANFFFRSHGLNSVKVLTAWTFDAQTHWPMSSSTSYGSYSQGIKADESRFHLGADLHSWRPSPVQLVIDLAFGEPEVTELKCKTGLQYSCPVATLTLAYIADGANNSWSSSSNGKSNWVTITFGQRQGQTNTTLVFIASPRASPLPIEIEALDKNGKIIEGAGGGASGNASMSSVRSTADKIDKVRFKYYPQRARLSVLIPEIPGVPPENRNVQNLFEQRIPYCRISAEYELRDLIQESVQMRFSMYQSLTPPPGMFPMILSNTTPARLLNTYMALLPPKTEIYVDPQKNEIESGGSPLQKLIQRFQNILR